MPDSNPTNEKPDLKTCIICDRELVSENYCKYHEIAYQNVMQSFDAWKEGYGELTFSEYLQKIITNHETGIWAKEVAEALSKKESEK